MFDALKIASTNALISLTARELEARNRNADALAGDFVERRNGLAEAVLEIELAEISLLNSDFPMEAAEPRLRHAIEDFDLALADLHVDIAAKGAADRFIKGLRGLSGLFTRGA